MTSKQVNLIIKITIIKQSIKITIKQSIKITIIKQHRYLLTWYWNKNIIKSYLNKNSP